ncbi:rop guanine nucleotide exchange factor 11-like isoform X1 [Brassica napus]|uniref:rop guanine nucleotide exchange factor 11-like isoform X1 n=1 Tax=Brassica napus TaxID=3708 RepID=UPI0020788874|nr:rop guanine nucleotide exchange factor 11-like isoform X1 [Brassica napus]
MEQEQESYKSRLFHFKNMSEHSASRHVKSWSSDCAMKIDGSDSFDDDDNDLMFRSQPGNFGSVERPPLPSSGDATPNRSDKIGTPRMVSSESMEAQLQAAMEQMKERFSKLLLGEDMSGGGKGVSSALALSNAITNLAASAFGEQRRLEPMPADRKARWRRELGWLISVADHIVEFAPTQQTNKDGSSMEVMTTRQRTDLLCNVPALKKLDAMLLVRTKNKNYYINLSFYYNSPKILTFFFVYLQDCLDKFKDQNEFYYVKKDSPDSSETRNDEKWWLPAVKVPPNGLSEMSRRFLQSQKECVNQVLKAAMAINAQVLSEMEIPESYLESLPKNGRASLGDVIYKMITVEMFDADQFLIEMDLSSEHKILDLKNKIEASIVIWKRKMVQKDTKSPWGSGVSTEKREQFEERAETILLLLKQGFPGISQSSLDISKIQCNRDVGLAILEGYSRVLESLAHTVMSKIEDVLYADQLTQEPTNAPSKNRYLVKETMKEERLSFSEDTATGTSLSDVMQWGNKNNEVKKESYYGDREKPLLSKVTGLMTTNKKSSYLETIGVMRSPTARYS